MNYKEKVIELLKSQELSKEQKEKLEIIFPELKESEDKRIREALISILKTDFEKDTTIYDISVGDIIAWLEKQNEKKSSDEVLKIRQEVYQSGYNDGYNHGCEDTKKQGKQKHKFNIGDIISNGQAVFRVDNITKNCIGQDCYFLINVEAEKNGNRYLILTDSHGDHSYLGEITWLCEQVDKSFEKNKSNI